MRTRFKPRSISRQTRTSHAASASETNLAKLGLPSADDRVLSNTNSTGMYCTMLLVAVLAQIECQDSLCYCLVRPCYASS